MFLKYFFLFSNFGPKYVKKCPSDPLDIILVFDKVEGVECESEVKTGTGSSLGRHFGQKPIFSIFWLFITPLLWAVQGPYLVPNLRSWP